MSANCGSSGALSPVAAAGWRDCRRLSTPIVGSGCPAERRQRHHDPHRSFGAYAHADFPNVDNPHDVELRTTGMNRALRGWERWLYGVTAGLVAAAAGLA